MDGTLLVLGNILELDDALCRGFKLYVFPTFVVRESGLHIIKRFENYEIKRQYTTQFICDELLINYGLGYMMMKTIVV